MKAWRRRPLNEGLCMHKHRQHVRRQNIATMRASSTVLPSQAALKRRPIPKHLKLGDTDLTPSQYSSFFLIYQAQGPHAHEYTMPTAYKYTRCWKHNVSISVPFNVLNGTFNMTTTAWRKDGKIRTGEDMGNHILGSLVRSIREQRICSSNSTEMLFSLRQADPYLLHSFTAV